MGALLYRSALHAEQIRQEMFVEGRFPERACPQPAVSGALNGSRSSRSPTPIRASARRLEVYAAGQYTWLPFEHIAAVRMKPPPRLRDLLWAPATRTDQRRLPGRGAG